MCGGSGVRCEVKVIELESGYQVQIKGANVKEALKLENLKKCIETCCSGGAPLKDACCR
jgi:hypothetical protein